jgi:ubiquinone/menaquinone biosynthesis C-methylase UbiE
MKMNFRYWIFRIWYWYINNVDKKADVIFMNYGYSRPGLKVRLEPKDEPNRYPIQLYYHLVSSVDLKGKSVLEVGCGRGGGLSFIANNFPVSKALGVDLNQRAANFCNQFYKIKGLSFMQGDAQDLNIPDNSFDAIINVESSHRYLEMEMFLSHVSRILRPGGYFLFTDFRHVHKMEELSKQLEKTGLEKLKEEIITPQVVNALQLDDLRKRHLVKKLTPGFLHSTALNFAGVIGSETYNRFTNRKFEYFSYVFRKN